MIKVGITGGIGSGKTTVCKLFALLGVPVYNADDEGKKMLDEDASVKKKILKIFGNEVLGENGLMDRKKISSIVFNNKQKLEELNSIIHPAVAEHFECWLKKHAEHKYIVKEAAIMFESGAYKQVDQVITVIASAEIRMKRAMQRDKISQEQVLERMKYQMSDEDKIKRSAYVIHNDEKQLLIPQVIAIHQSLNR